MHQAGWTLRAIRRTQETGGVEEEPMKTKLTEDHGELKRCEIWAPPDIWKKLKAKAALEDKRLRDLMIEILTEATNN